MITYQIAFGGKYGELRYIGATLSRMSEKQWACHLAASDQSPEFTTKQRFWGHYFDAEVDAINDLNNRVRELVAQGYQPVLKTMPTA